MKVRTDTPEELVDNTNANLHTFAKQVGCMGWWGALPNWGAEQGVLARLGAFCLPLCLALHHCSCLTHFTCACTSSTRRVCAPW